MRATHTDYLHPKHLRVEAGEKYPAWNVVDGFHEKPALCVSPGSEMYRKLYRPNLPKWNGAKQ